MPDLVSMTALTMTACVALRAQVRRGSAVSAEGEYVRSHVTEVWDNFGRSISMQGAHADLLDQLDALIAEHVNPGWDGNVAPPVSYATAQNARDLIKALPATVSSPELAVEPDDAAISFEWYGGYRKVFAVSVGNSGRLACAGLDGTDQWHAALHFEGETVPTFVLDSIRRVCA